MRAGQSGTKAMNFLALSEVHHHIDVNTTIHYTVLDVTPQQQVHHALSSKRKCNFIQMTSTSKKQQRNLCSKRCQTCSWIPKRTNCQIVKNKPMKPTRLTDNTSKMSSLILQQSIIIQNEKKITDQLDYSIASKLCSRLTIALLLIACCFFSGLLPIHFRPILQDHR